MHDFFRGGTGTKDLGDTARFQAGGVLVGDDAAREYEDVFPSLLVKQIENSRE